jgi:hypothetical protein
MKTGQPRVPKAIAVANNNVIQAILSAGDKFEQIAGPSVGMIDGGFPSDNYSNIATIDGGTP